MPRIGSEVIVGPHARVDKSAIVIGNSVVADTAIVTDESRVSNSFICGETVVCDGAVVHNSVIRGKSVIHHSAVVIGCEIEDSFIRGFALCSNVKNSTVVGRISYQKFNGEKIFDTRE